MPSSVSIQKLRASITGEPLELDTLQVKPQRPADSGGNYSSAKRWLVDSLGEWLESLDAECRTPRGGLKQGHAKFTDEFSATDDSHHRASSPSKSRFRSSPLRGTSDQPAGAPFQELLAQIQMEHKRQLEELRLELTEDGRREKQKKEDDARIALKMAEKERKSSERFTEFTKRRSKASQSEGNSTEQRKSVMTEAVEEACEIFMNREVDAVAEECWVQKSGGNTAMNELPQGSESEVRISAGYDLETSGSTSDQAARYWSGADSREQDMADSSMSALLSAVSNNGVGSDSVALLASHDKGEPGAPSISMDADFKKKAGTMCQLFNTDPNLLLGSCFHMWCTHSQQMRKPTKFVALNQWSQVANDGTGQRPGIRPSALGGPGVATTASASIYEVQRDSTRDDRETPLRCCILYPSSAKRLIWDLIGAALLFSDLILIPLSAFEPEWGFLTVIDMITLIFWTMDMLMSCRTGYLSRGVTIMSPGKILVNYARTWFVLDVLVVVPDWIFLLADNMQDGAGSQNSSKLLRALRIVRMARLLRLVKLKRFLTMVRDRIDSEIVFIVVNIMQLILMLLFVNHFLASGWYIIGAMFRDLGQPNWIESDQGFADVSIGYRYTTALHWSLTQFTPASMSVQPMNEAERTFAITCLVCGLVLFSSFISNITTSMTQLRSMNDDKSKQFWLLRRFLRQQEVGTALSFRILRYLEYACREQKDLVSESRVWVLGLLSDQLKNELHYVVSFSCMISHPLFERTSAASSVTMHRLTAGCLSEKSLASRDILLHAGSVASHMYIVRQGDVSYVKADNYEDELTLCKEDWFCESCLWTTWIHLGIAKATTECQLVCIDAKQFGELIQKDFQAWAITAVYANNYVKWLSTIMRRDLTDAAYSEEMKELQANFLYEEEDEDPEDDDGRKAAQEIPERKAKRLTGTEKKSLASKMFSRGKSTDSLDGPRRRGSVDGPGRRGLRSSIAKQDTGGISMKSVFSGNFLKQDSGGISMKSVFSGSFFATKSSPRGAREGPLSRGGEM